jgi:hypothetical protein
MKADCWLIHHVKHNTMQLNGTTCAVPSGGALAPPAHTVTKGLGRFAW